MSVLRVLDPRSSFFAATPAPARLGGWRLPRPATKKARPSSSLNGSASSIDPRAASPRDLAALSTELYLAGAIDLRESTVLGFQADLHPHFSRTIGALTGRKPAPDTVMDHVAAWEARLAFAARHHGDGHPRTEIIRNIINALREATLAATPIRSAG